MTISKKSVGIHVGYGTSPFLPFAPFCLFPFVHHIILCSISMPHRFAPLFRSTACYILFVSFRFPVHYRWLGKPWSEIRKIQSVLLEIRKDVDFVYMICQCLEISHNLLRSSPHHLLQRLSQRAQVLIQPTFVWIVATKSAVLLSSS